MGKKIGDVEGCCQESLDEMSGLKNFRSKIFALHGGQIKELSVE
jgi:hypothetical protein